jgi:putative transposase
MRGVTLSYETIREWCLKFGQTYANGLRRGYSRLGDRWHMDEVFLKIKGRLHYLWCAVDQDGDVLGYSYPDSERQEGSQEVLSQAIRRTAVCSACAHYR